MNDDEKNLLMDAYIEYKKKFNCSVDYSSQDLIIVSLENEKSLYELLLDPVEGRKVLIKNQYGLFGSLLYKYIDKLDLELLKGFILSDVQGYGRWGKFRKSSLNFIPYEIRNDKEFIESLLQYNSNALFLASNELKKDSRFIIECIRKYHCDLKYAGKVLRSDKVFVLQCLKEFKCTLEYVGDELKKDEEIILIAITNNPNSYNYISEELKENREFVEKLLDVNPRVFRYIDEELQNDKKLAMKCLNVDPSLYVSLSSNLKNDKDIFKCVMHGRRYGADAINFAGEEILTDKELMLEFANEHKLYWDVMIYFKHFDTWDEDMLKACFEKPYCIYSYDLYIRFLKKRKSVIKDYFSCVAKIINYKFDINFFASEKKDGIVDEYLEYIIMFAKKKITISVTSEIYESIYNKYGIKYFKYIKCDNMEIYDVELPF